LDDLADLEALREQSASLADSARSSTLRLNLHRPPEQKPERVHLKIVKLGEPVPIRPAADAGKLRAAGDFRAALRAGVA